MSFLPGLEPDFEVKQELRFIGGMPDLHQFDFIFISCSGGKDSHAMAYLLAELADRQGYNKEKMELLYADTGLEWHDTFDQVKRIGAAIGIAAVKVLPKYKLLDNVRRRWAKFNGLEWGDERENTPDGKTGAWQVRSRTLLNDSAQAITNACQSSSMSVSEQQDYVVQKSGKTISNRTLCSQQIRGVCGIDHFRASMHDFALHGENKSRNINISANPFPTAHRRFCTGEGKNNTIFERVRKQSQAEDG